MNAIFDASEFLAQVLARYASIEANCRDTQIPDLEHFEDDVVAVYAAVLRYFAKVKISERAGKISMVKFKIARAVLTFPECVLESLASLTGQLLQPFKEVINSRDNDTEIWRKSVEHQCWAPPIVDSVNLC